MKACIDFFIKIFFLLIILLPKILAQTQTTTIGTADTLEVQCNLFNSIPLSNLMTGVFDTSNRLCQFFDKVSIPGYDNMASFCSSFFTWTHSSCRPIMFDQRTDLDTYIQRGILNTTSRFFIGLKRDNCSEDWYWEYSNGTRTVFPGPNGDIPTLPAKNTDCNNLFVAYRDNQFSPVGYDFQPNVVACTCGYNQNVTIMPTNNFQTACPILADSQYQTHAYWDDRGRCNLGIRVANFSYDLIAQRCTTIVPPVFGAKCQVMHHDMVAEMNLEFNNQLMQYNDSAFFGLDRPSCGEDWRNNYNNGSVQIFRWEENNGTMNFTGDLTAQIIPDKNQNCSQNVLFYKNGQYSTVDRATTPTDVILCTCANDNLLLAVASTTPLGFTSPTTMPGMPTSSVVENMGSTSSMVMPTTTATTPGAVNPASTINAIGTTTTTPQAASHQTISAILIFMSLLLVIRFFD